MSGYAPALLETLLRLLPPPEGASAGPPLQELISALAVALEQGELGLDLQAEAPAGVSAADWPQQHLQSLEASGWLVPAEALDSRPEAPIVHDGRWLRWRRWHLQLQQCLERLMERAASPLEPAAAATAISAARRQAEAAGLDSQQSAAVAALLRHRLVLLSGGPGTGKTSTVVQMLAAALRLDGGLRLHLAAPTGKAAARLAAAVSAGATELEPSLAAGLQTLPCTTLHRLLEAQGGQRFRRDSRHPLELDLLVVDEVSMVDLPLMAALLEALPPQARLLLVGDAGQLPPVGPGAVLEELCRPQRRQRLGEAAVELSTTYRNNGAIAAIAGQLRQQADAGEPLRWLRPALQQLSASDNLHWHEHPLGRMPAAVLEPVQAHQRRLTALARELPWCQGEADAEASERLLAELEQLIVLSPIRQGSWGVEALHRQLLGAAATAPPQRWPLGTPVLNRLNRPEQGLANGDIGVLVQRDQERLVLMAGGRLLHPARLSGAEPALALTVHKAQGSQYGQVLLLLPPSRHNDPRLLYTGLTRARRQALLVTPAEPA